MYLHHCGPQSRGRCLFSSIDFSHQKEVEEREGCRETGVLGRKLFHLEVFLQHYFLFPPHVVVASLCISHHLYLQLLIPVRNFLLWKQSRILLQNKHTCMKQSLKIPNLNLSFTQTNLAIGLLFKFLCLQLKNVIILIFVLLVNGLCPDINNYGKWLIDWFYIEILIFT